MVHLDASNAKGGRPTLHSRRRSLKALLQLPGKLSRSSTCGSLGPAFHSVGNVPPDIILEIADRLPSSDLLNLSLTSSYMRLLLMPLLYEIMILKSSRMCKITLNLLKRKPELCQYIKKLAVRPNYYLAWPKPNEPISEDWVARTIEEIAGSLTRIEVFDWDGLEMPQDHLWVTLKEKCPTLKTVYSNVGDKPLDPDSHLYDFDNLENFSLTARHGLGGTNLFPPLDPLPPKLWDMLLNRCPDLSELTICSFSSSSRMFDIRPLTGGSFSKLQSLTLGTFGYESDFSLSSPLSSGALGAFLSRHPSLTYLRLSWNFKRWQSLDSIPLHLTPTATPTTLTNDDNEAEAAADLPNLTTFVGIYQQLIDIPHPEILETIDLTCEPIYDTRLSLLQTFLRRCPSLTSLDIWMHIPDEREIYAENTTLGGLKDLLMVCESLVDFHFMCTTSFGAKALQSMCSFFYLLPNLRTFSLTKGHKYLDEPMLESALRVIGSDVPNSFQQVNIRWAKEKCPNHLKQEGTYDVLRGNDGRISHVIVAERGITVLGACFTRRRKLKYRRGKKDREPPSLITGLNVVTAEPETIDYLGETANSESPGSSWRGTMRRLKSTSRRFSTMSMSDT